ncbi:MAG: glycosyltransferase [Chitinophagaceae bacterium]
MATRIFFTVTNDLNYDQRMIRICTTLANTGFDVVLVGRKMKNSIVLKTEVFRQKRLNCFFSKGKLFYIEYNTRLFFFLLFQKIDCICAIDLDTILPVYFISRIKKVPRVYDAHELFCEMKEIVTRKNIYRFWKRVEKFAVPKFPNGYTVNKPIAEEFNKMYGVNYEVIRSIAVLKDFEVHEKKERYLLYQGAVNEGRSFETLIPAMKDVNSKLLICGDGNFMQEVKELVAQNKLEDKIEFKGKIPPSDLNHYTNNAYIGLTLFDDRGLSNYFSLANRFFDYIHAGIPQVCVDFPVYRELNNQYHVAVLVNDLSPLNLAKELNHMLEDKELYESLVKNCLATRKILNWQEEEKRLLKFYKDLFNG